MDYKDSSKHYLPLSKAFLLILLSVLFVSGTALMGWLYFLHVKDRKLKDDNFRITSIVRRSNQKNVISTNFLAEHLNLSLDKPINLFQFDRVEGIQKLLSIPLIKRVDIKKILPGTLLIDYEVRKPIALIGNCKNVAVDKDGFTFPFAPYFQTKNHPIFYLSNFSQEGRKNILQQKDLLLCMDVLQKFEKIKNYNLILKKIDVRNAFADSIGQREIVVKLERIDQLGTIFLRLNSVDYEQNIANYYVLRIKELMQQKDKDLYKFKIIDFRVAQLAFIKKEM